MLAADGGDVVVEVSREEGRGGGGLVVEEEDGDRAEDLHVGPCRVHLGESCCRVVAVFHDSAEEAVAYVHVYFFGVGGVWMEGEPW